MVAEISFQEDEQAWKEVKNRLLSVCSVEVIAAHVLVDETNKSISKS